MKARKHLQFTAKSPDSVTVQECKSEVEFGMAMTGKCESSASMKELKWWVLGTFAQTKVPPTASDEKVIWTI